MAKHKKNRIKKSRIREHLIEGIFVFSGVFVAFFLTEYREAQKDDNTLEISLQHIASEMKHNHNRVEYIFQYYTDLLSEIDSLKRNDPNWKELDGSDLKSWSGLQIPLLRSASYQTFLNSNLSDHLEFERAELLTEVYYAQSISERLDKAFMESSITNLEQFLSLAGLKDLTETYLSTLPDVMLAYQSAQKEWLDAYGYDLPVKNSALKQVIEERRQYSYNQ